MANGNGRTPAHTRRLDPKKAAYVRRRCSPRLLRSTNELHTDLLRKCRGAGTLKTSEGHEYHLSTRIPCHHLLKYVKDSVAGRPRLGASLLLCCPVLTPVTSYLRPAQNISSSRETWFKPLSRLLFDNSRHNILANNTGHARFGDFVSFCRIKVGYHHRSFTRDGQHWRS